MSIQLLIEQIQDVIARTTPSVPEVPRRVFERIIIHLRQPETYASAVASSRSLAEWYLKELYAAQKGFDSGQLGYVKTETMMQALSKEMPPNQGGVLKTLQALQNFYSHVESEATGVSESTVVGCINLVFSLFESIPKRANPDAHSNTSSRTQKLLQKPLVIGVDVGTSKISAAVVTVANMAKPQILKRALVYHDEIESERGILEKIEAVIAQVLIGLELSLEDLEGIGVGLPGQVDHRTGLLKFAPGLKLRNIAVATRLSSKLGLPVFAENDVNCSALAELRWGVGRTFSNFICVFVGTGIGAGLVFDRKLYHGGMFAAGEIGHMKVDFSETARQCTCGSRGCFEEYASARAIIRLTREAAYDAVERKLGGTLEVITPENVTPEGLVAGIKSGDPACIALAERVASSLAIGISNVANLLNPEAIILGGGIIKGFYGFDFFNNLFDRKFRELTLDACSGVSILGASFGDDTSVLGAASLATENAPR